MTKLVTVFILFALGACSPESGWSPDSTETRQYFHYGEGDQGACQPECRGFDLYVFDDGELVYFGAEGNQVKGIHRVRMSPSIFKEIETLLFKSRFQKYEDSYTMWNSHCWADYNTDEGTLWISANTINLKKKLHLDYGCSWSSGGMGIRFMALGFKKLIPAQNLVGAEQYERDNDYYFIEDEEIAKSIKALGEDTIADRHDPLFAPYYETIMAFALRHNLLVEKHYHDGPIWKLNFEHPLGGKASIHILIQSGKITVSTSWWQYDEVGTTRYTKSGHIIDISASSIPMSDALIEVLKENLAFQLDDWSSVYDIGASTFGGHTPSELRALEPKWPKVRP